MHLLSKAAFLIYSLVPAMWHLASARVLLIKVAVVSSQNICHAMLRKGGLEMMVLN